MHARPPESETVDLIAPNALDDLRQELSAHPLYTQLRTIDDLRYFMERHVICVWDFMSLLKSLQSTLTCVTWPWIPPLDASAARLVNDIVLGEETDEVGAGVFKSHFDWYLEAMSEVGANRAPIDALVSALREGVHWTTALRNSGLPKEAREFAVSTLRLAAGPAHVRASAFFHGRENVIPAMFIELVRHLREEGHPCGVLLEYLERHIEVDGGDHGPMAERLLANLIAGREERAREAEQAGVLALRARVKLWTAIVNGLNAPEAPRTRSMAIRSFFSLGG